MKTNIDDVDHGGDVDDDIADIRNLGPPWVIFILLKISTAPCELDLLSWE